MESFDKILDSVLRDGRVIVVFDNGNNLTLRSNLLAMILTSGNAEERTLGKTEMNRIASRAAHFHWQRAVDQRGRRPSTG